MVFDVRQVLDTCGTDTSMVPQILVALAVFVLVSKLVRDNNAVWVTLG